MPSFIGSFNHDGERYYVEHSTVSDSPCCCAMTEGVFAEWYLEQSDLKPGPAIRELLPRMRRAAKHGSSSMRTESFEDLVGCNRAGPKEARLTIPGYIALVLSTRTRYRLPQVLFQENAEPDK